MVTRGRALALALEDVVIMLPGWIRIGPVLPFTGERIRVNSRLSRAASAVALASRKAASASSTSCGEMAFWPLRRV
ncbi:hypothetical protein D3C83_97340 [compost metagenome]